MSVFRLTEKQKRAWAFAVIATVWIAATVLIVWHLSPKADSDTEARRARLANYDSVLNEQDALMRRQQALSMKIRETKFDVYQSYIIFELREEVNGIHRENTPIEFHSKRISSIMELLLNAREELVSKQRNIARIGDEVQNCREGNQDFQTQ